MIRCFLICGTEDILEMAHNTGLMPPMKDSGLPPSGWGAGDTRLAAHPTFASLHDFSQASVQDIRFQL